MSKTLVRAELPSELVAQAYSYVEEGWAVSFDELLAEALRRLLESHSARVTEAAVRTDVQWGLHGND